MRRIVRKAFRWLLFAALVAFVIILASNRYLDYSTATYRTPEPFTLPPVQAIIVPGAAVFRSGEPTPAYGDRIDTARALYASGAAKKILVSGDGARDGHDEVTPARDRLLAAGVASEDIFLDYEGVNTYETMRRARAEYGVSSAIIVTQPFHLPRAVFLARWFGIEAYGVETAEWTGTLRDTLRESFAAVKAVFDVLSTRGTTLPPEHDLITDDGRASWRE